MNKTGRYFLMGVSALAVGVASWYLYRYIKDMNKEKIQQGSFEIVVQ